MSRVRSGSTSPLAQAPECSVSGTAETSPLSAPSALTLFSSPLQKLDRQLWSLVLHHLPWREKLVEVSHLCSSIPAFEPGDFRCDRLDCGSSRYSSQDPFYSDGRRRLFSHIRQLRLFYKQLPTESFPSVLCPPSPAAPSEFFRLRLLELEIHSGVATDFERLIPSSAAFPSLEELHVNMSGHWEEDSKRDELFFTREQLLPLSRLPLLRRLHLSHLLTFDGFFFLCTLPVTKLDLTRSYLDDRTGPRVPLTAAVTTTWEEVVFPDSIGEFHPSRGLFATVRIEALAGYAESCTRIASAASTNSDSDRQTRLQRLALGWNLSQRCMRVIARIPSLMELTRGMESECEADTVLDLSPLFTSDLLQPQPLLPRLQTCHFPRVEQLSERARAALVDSCADFLTAYSQQLRELDFSVYSRESTGRLLESLLQCAQLRTLGIGSSCDNDDEFPSSETYVDVEQLDPAVAFLPPLSLLTELKVDFLYLSVQAMTQFLTNCPALSEILQGTEAQSFPWLVLPPVIELADGRQVTVHRTD
jgi:hypothetical protein